MAHCLAQLNLGFILDEPINSNAGESLQVQIDGNPLYMECLRKDPHQMAYFHDGGDKFTYYGTCTYDCSFGASSADIYYTGTNNLLLKQNNHLIKFQYPKLYLSGFMSGNYHAYWDNHLYLWSNKLKAFA